MSHDDALVSADNSGGFGRRPPPLERADDEVSLEEHMKNGGGRVVPPVIDARVLSRIDGVGSGDTRVESGDRDRDAPTLEVRERKKEEVCEIVLFWEVLVGSNPGRDAFFCARLQINGLCGFERWGGRRLMNITEEE